MTFNNINNDSSNNIMLQKIENKLNNNTNKIGRAHV